MGKKVALVLSSGGARGLAHIGVIERLEEEGFEISSIAGTSIGAVVGAYYACGQLDTYKKWAMNLDRLDVFNLFDFTLSSRGIIKGDKLFNTLKDLIEDRPLENLRIPFKAIATDIHHRKEVVFDQGSMYDALRASTAIPTVLRAYSCHGTEMVDGGVVNPLPLNRVARIEGDQLVAVNVQANTPFVKIAGNHPPKKTSGYGKLLHGFIERWNQSKGDGGSQKDDIGFLDIMNRSLDLLQDQLCQMTIETHRPDMLVEISKDACGTFEFYRAKKLIEIGRHAFDQSHGKSNR